VKVCSQHAKAFIKLTEEVEALLASGDRVAAIVAPSFPAEFGEIADYRKFVGMVRALGFDLVAEVAFGADLVAKKFNALIHKSKKPLITSDCPAIVYYIEHYFPGLIHHLAPVASPMVAMSRVMRKKYGENIKIVFVGPCIAKKAESAETDQELTFTELRELFTKHHITPEEAVASDFDPPFSGKGAIFPVSRGLLQNIDVAEDIDDGRMITAEGKTNFKEAIKEFENGVIDQNLELLCCEGCIMGPGTNTFNTNKYARKVRVNEYVKKKLQNLKKDQWEADMALYSRLDLKQSFKSADRRMQVPSREEIDEALANMGKYHDKDHLNCGACGYPTCEEHAIAIVQGLAETEMCLPFSIEKLHASLEDLKISNEQLNTAKEALKQQEKLAHMGQLSASIAHELNNPLGVIIMYSNILLDELSEDHPFSEDLKLIVEQSDRCKSIVGGLLNFARKNQVKFDKINLKELVDKSLSAIILKNGVTLNVDNWLKNPMVTVDIEQMIQVISNLAKNAVEAMPDGGELNITLSDTADKTTIQVTDQGVGISKENREKIFEPFFTTKEIGKGTGLGLATIYGIVKMHNGRIDLDSNTEPEAGPTGTTFTVTLPRHPKSEKQKTF
jgi:signal transduction histidine kinase